MKVNATLDDEGRLKIPRKTRELLNLLPGSKITLTIDKELAERQTQQTPLAKLVKCDGRWVMDRPFTPTISDDDIIAAIKSERDEREQRIAGDR